MPSIHWSNTFLLSTIFFSISFSFRSVSFLSFAMVFSRSFLLSDMVFCRSVLSFAMAFSRLWFFLGHFLFLLFSDQSFLLSAIVSFNPIISPLLAAAEKISCSFLSFFRKIERTQKKTLDIKMVTDYIAFARSFKILLVLGFFVNNNQLLCLNNARKNNTKDGC